MNPARSINTATIAFGLINIPCKVFSTNESTEEIKFNLLTKSGARVEQVYRDKVTQEIVPREELLKGYEHTKDTYVTFTTAEIEALDSVATNRIEIEEYVPAEEVDGLYLESHYYLGPDKGAEKGYALLAAALNELGFVGIGRWSTRGKEHVVAIRPFVDGLMIHRLRYEREVKPWEAVPRVPAEVTPAMLASAKQLIRASAVNELDLSKYTDRVHARVKELVEAKIAGGEITASQGEVVPNNVIDIMDALKASLAQAAIREPEPAPPVAEPAKKPTPIKGETTKKKGKAAPKKKGRAA